MKRYSIFKKSTKFCWSRDRIIYPILLVVLFTYFVKAIILKIEENFFDIILIYTIMSVWIGGLILKLLKIGKPDSLCGDLDGFLTFELEKITIGDTIYTLDEIKYMRISNDDYYGKLKGSGKSFNSNRSNGVDNLFQLTLIDGKEIVVNYELYNSADLQKIKPELIHYHKLEKLNFENLVNVLGYIKKIEIEEFQKELT